MKDATQAQQKLPSLREVTRQLRGLRERGVAYATLWQQEGLSQNGADFYAGDALSDPDGDVCYGREPLQCGADLVAAARRLLAAARDGMR